MKRIQAAGWKDLLNQLAIAYAEGYRIVKGTSRVTGHTISLQLAEGSVPIVAEACTGDVTHHSFSWLSKVKYSRAIESLADLLETGAIVSSAKNGSRAGVSIRLLGEDYEPKNTAEVTAAKAPEKAPEPKTEPEAAKEPDPKPDPKPEVKPKAKPKAKAKAAAKPKAKVKKAK